MSQAVHLIQLAGSDQSFPCAENDTLLRAALRSGIAFPYECNVGSCGNCKFELLDGVMTSCWPEAPGLSDKDRARNRGLGCQSKPTGPLQIKLRTSDKYAPQHRPVRTAATFISARAITHDLSEFKFETAVPVAFLSGQYALVQMAGIAGPRAYSMSNVGLIHGHQQASQLMEFQVRRVPGGQGSAHLFDQLAPGDQVEIDGPYGMAYLREDVERDILCVAGGSGLAPMVSIARGAFNSPKMQGRKLHFYYGARSLQDVCGLDMLQSLPDWSSKGHYQAVISGEPEDRHLPNPYLRGFAHDAVAQNFGEALQQMEIYFAGPALMGQSLLKTLIDLKVPMDQVHFDQFY
ncbi:2Fe-2S iron-sulfur cluster-binding protein [Limnohabitans sp. Hippo4]|uniref:2Fe-2S iron-sulfur cluster-binding protein n=1 Tax=Limnohabitans sp. Hippo4 TaxID=1826167 RepID=UPI000D380C9A|nr:2Fe-2S iron-sulfur cluster-binding protein [Limnohabitans sp. Hippo4]PUE34684.1 oxidoreductase [Limnohabitans sp. Hippo4]